MYGCKMNEQTEKRGFILNKRGGSKRFHPSFQRILLEGVCVFFPKEIFLFGFDYEVVVVFIMPSPSTVQLSPPP